MAIHPPEQVVHDRINLGRLVRRLEKSIASDNWNEANQQNEWIKAQGTLEKVKYARTLLKNVETYDASPSPKRNQRYQNFEQTLGRIESFLLEIEKRLAPHPTRPTPLLPQIPIPVVTARTPEIYVDDSGNDASSPQVEHTATESIAQSATEDQFLLPADIPPSPLPSATFSLPSALLSPDFSARSAPNIVPAQAFLQNSSIVQQELSEQLAQMAAQLKRNATHFSESLAKDQAVVEDASVKIESNFGTMQTQRVRLRDHRGKSGSTTCLVLMSILVVVISFVLTFFVIRLTRII